VKIYQSEESRGHHRTPVPMSGRGELAGCGLRPSLDSDRLPKYGSRSDPLGSRRPNLSPRHGKTQISEAVRRRDPCFAIDWPTIPGVMHSQSQILLVRLCFSKDTGLQDAILFNSTERHIV